MADALRIGFVGAGNMGQCAHLKNYATLDGCEVTALAELRPQLAAKVAARYGIPRTYATHAAMFAAEELDGIVASQQFVRHGQIVPELLAVGVPVFIEKPLAATVAVGEQILKSGDGEAAGRLMVGYHKRSDPAVEYARAEIDRLKTSGELGAMTYVRISMPPGAWIAGGFDDLITTDESRPDLQPDPPADDLDDETAAKHMKFVNYYIHQVNLMRHLLGESYAVRYADASGVVLAGESASGVPCLIEMATHTTSRDWQESAFVCFERGTIRIDIPPPLAVNRAGRVEILRDPGGDAVPEVVIPHMPTVHAMRRQAENFLAFVRGERTPPCGIVEALEDLKVAREYTRLRVNG